MFGPKKKVLVFVTLLAMFTNAASAKAATYAGIRLTDSAFREQKLPQNQRIKDIALEQDYAESTAKIFTVDLNGDGLRDFIIRSNDSLCGTGGCGYVFVDGKSFMTLGELTGTEPIICDNKVNGHALIMFFKYSAANKARLEVWAFNKKKYAYSKSIQLKGKELASQEKLLRIIE